MISISNIFFYIIFVIIVRCQCRIYQFPTLSVKFDNIIYPAFFIKPRTDPSMIDTARIPNLKLRRNSLRSEHRCHQCRIIKTYPFLCLQCLIHRWQITFLHILCFVIIIFYILNNIMVYLFNNGKSIFLSFRKFFCFLHRFCFTCKLYILIWI